MALVQCPECKHEISTTAAACPHCGAKPNAAEKPKNRTRTIIILAVVVGLIFSFAFLTSPSGTGGAGESKYDYRYWLERQLKEPGSAEYRNDSMYTGDDGRVYYCGEVNAKNGYGGYTGFVRFLGGKGLFVFENGTDEEKMLIRLLWPKNCLTKID